MFKEQIERIRKGMETAFIQQNTVSDVMYQPQLVFNNPEAKSKVIATLQRELNRCDSFKFSVAFITDSGIEGLLGILKELEAKHVKGQILTTDYLCFTEPKALEKLAQLSNIEIKMYRTGSDGANGFHTKGYIFSEKEIFHIIIGSANLTQSALSVNKEWNTKVVSTNEGAYAQTIVGEFDELWNHPASQYYADCIDTYKEEYKAMKQQTEIRRHISTEDLLQYRPKLVPNTMQVALMDQLEKYVQEGKKKALLISATGTGKTYAAAFGAQRLRPKRILFVVHREQIARQAMKTFRNVFGNSHSMGILSGNEQGHMSDFVFATVQTISKEETLHRFKRSAFDIIIIDEVHRAGAKSYQRIMQYFEPGLMFLGMTASPERTDGFNIYELFDYNIAYEIRLQHALEENLLCPFHYFGISDLHIEDVNADIDDFARLNFDERVKHVMKEATYYGYSGDRVKGLIFCSTKVEAAALSEKFNQFGWRTQALSGENSQDEREAAIKRLCDDTLPKSERLDYIVTVDIFNEGIDIPQINQVILLRPTESPIIFVQQLGRGLRKADKKEYVVILDFVGNYTNNFMIPVALSGDRSYNKDNLRRYVSEGTSLIPGASTIYFDAITKERIYQSLDTARFDMTGFLRDNYVALKNKLGRIPDLMDFEKFGSIDVFLLINKYGSYHEFLTKYDKDYKTIFSKKAEAFLKIISETYMVGKRIHELLLLQMLMEQPVVTWDEFLKTLNEEYGLSDSVFLKENLLNVLTGQFYTGNTADLYRNNPYIEVIDDEIICSEGLAKALENETFKNVFAEHIKYGMYCYNHKYSKLYKNRPFQLYAKYTYEDICRLLEWPQKMVAQNMGGYVYNRDTHTMPVFINYEKEEHKEDTIKYEDRFVHQRHLIGLSKVNRNLQSEDVRRLSNTSEDRVLIDLFVRKNKKDKGVDAKEFYYLGTMVSDGNTHLIEMETPKGDLAPAVEIHYILDEPVREDIYEYITT